MAASRGDHAHCPSGMILNNRYKVVKECGCGNFSKVFECLDTKNNNTSVAVKLLKKEYASDAAFEKDILKALGNLDKAGEKKVANMRDYFVHNRHPSFVFDLKGASLRSCKLGVTRGNVPMDEFKKFAWEMLQTLKFLHSDVKMVHTDIKPENILLDKKLAAGVAGIGEGWTMCDFGSASFLRKDRLDSDLISTRPYRAPEVVMGNGWHTAADMWSMACVLFEVVAGSRLFEIHDDAEHLHAFEARLQQLPTELKKKSKHSTRFFSPDGSHRRPGTKTIRPMKEVLKDHKELLGLLESMLDFDANRRLTAKEALNHSFFSSFHGGSSSKASSSSVPTKLNSAPSTPTDAAPKKFNPSPAALESGSARPLRERSLDNTAAAAPSKKADVGGAAAAGKPPAVPKMTPRSAAQASIEAARMFRNGQISSKEVVAAGKPSYNRTGSLTSGRLY